jgi:ribosomal protein S18 acetylase RimI-like enzyme
VTSFSIRRSTPPDAPTIAALGARLFVQAYGPTHPEPELSRYLARAFGIERFERELADPDVRVPFAESAAGIPIGYAHMRVTSSGAAPEGVPPGRAVEIVRFYVDAAWHGQGVAQALMKECEREARAFGGDAMWLSVWQKAPRPQAFYRRMGFEIVGTTTFAFGDRIDDDFVMARPIP